MIAFQGVKAGDVLYDVHRYKTNGGGSRLGCWPVHVLSVDYVTETASVRWNGNAPRTYSKRQIQKLRRSEPKRKP